MLKVILAVLVILYCAIAIGFAACAVIVTVNDMHDEMHSNMISVRLSAYTITAVTMLLSSVWPIFAAIEIYNISKRNR